jgi:hypothetical protein
MQISRTPAQLLILDNQSRRAAPPAVPDPSQTGPDEAAAQRPVAIECCGRMRAMVRFARPLAVARECGVVGDGGVAYMIGVSHARVWFVRDGQAVEVVRHGFARHGIEMDIMPWETPAAALRRHTGR